MLPYLLYCELLIFLCHLSRGRIQILRQEARLKYPGGLLYGIAHYKSLPEGDIGYHEIHGLPGFSVFTKIGREVIFHRHPVLGEEGKDHENCIDQKKQISLINDKRTNRDQGGLMILHGSYPLS